MDETGRAALFMAAESPLLICPHMTEEKDINYKPVTVLLEVASLRCLQYGHSRVGSDEDHQNYPGLLCSSHHDQRGSLSSGVAARGDVQHIPVGCVPTNLAAFKLVRTRHQLAVAYLSYYLKRAACVFQLLTRLVYRLL